MSNEHLSQEEIDRLLNGESTPSQEEHDESFPNYSQYDTPPSESKNIETTEGYPESSQDEIDRMFNESSNPKNGYGSGNSYAANSEKADDRYYIPEEYRLTDFQKDGLGEIGNISMGTASTTLSVLLAQQVNITTPVVSVTNWESIRQSFNDKVILVKVKYTKGLLGSSILLLKAKDSMIISDLMMGGDGTNTEDELSDFHISAISEAMNQMIGSSATSMSSMFDEIVDISPPEVFSKILSEEDLQYILNDTSSSSYFVKTAFRLTVGNLIDSEIMQMLALPFAIDMFDTLLNKTGGDKENNMPEDISDEALSSSKQSSTADILLNMGAGKDSDKSTGNEEIHTRHDENIVQFPAEKSRNIDMLMAVPMDITVELGRAEKSIKDILNIGPGSILELDKFQGDKVDIMVNGKKIAMGEVVVIDDSYGVRITDIVKSKDRF